MQLTNDEALRHAFLDARTQNAWLPEDVPDDVLRKLIEVNDPKHAPASYILAVMLERKRVLKVKEQIKTEGKRIFVYEQPKTGDVFTIPDPNLQLNQLDEVQRDVAQLLEHGLSGETPSAAPSPTVEAASNPENPAVAEAVAR